MYNSSDYFSGVMVYGVKYGAFSGVCFILFNFLVHLKANYRRIITFKIQIPLKAKFKIKIEVILLLSSYHKMTYVVQHGDFLGVGVVLFNFLIYL
jgi:hypothetical protein